MDLKRMRLDLAERLLSRRIILVDGEITNDSSEYIHTSLLMLDDKAKKKITLCFRSGGGDAYAGLIIHDTLRMMRSPTVGIVFAAASAACDILQGCEKRMICKSGKILIHSPSRSISGLVLDEMFDEKVKSSKTSLESVKLRTEEIFLERTGLSKKKYQKLVQKGDRFTEYIYASEALKLNLVDAIIPDDYILLGD